MTTFNVYGVPAPQGSKTRMPNGAMVESSSATGRAKLTDWRGAVAAAAQAVAHDSTAGCGMFTEPVLVRARFRFPVAKSRAKKCAQAGTLPKGSKPDLDKLLRSTGDALVTGGMIARDELIVAWVAEKIEVPEGAWSGVELTVEDYGL